MLKTKTLLLICSIGTFLVSCQKEQSFELSSGSQPGGGGNNNSAINIIGDWNFVGMHAKTYVAITATEAGETMKTITTSDYESADNAGTMKITNNQTIAEGIAYSVNDEAHSAFYLNGMLEVEMDEPFSVTIPPADQTSNYVRNRNDSLTFASMPTLMPNLAGPTPDMTGEVGSKLSMRGDTLFVLMNYVNNQTTYQQGIPVFVDVKAEVTVKLKRK